MVPVYHWYHRHGFGDRTNATGRRLRTRAGWRNAIRLLETAGLYGRVGYLEHQVRHVVVLPYTFGYNMVLHVFYAITPFSLLAYVCMCICLFMIHIHTFS